ncbi:isotocin receptor-like [Oratosquilla oratoria]|uniref:isotocin receptor-like n=1 Tax=Oratosquilla oratoria TaxID=337810 RepID=UPI003F7618DC
MRHLTTADMLVVLFASSAQIVWDQVGQAWYGGEALCRLVKFLQTFSITSSNYILVVIAVDRLWAIWNPLRRCMAVSLMAGAGWIVSAVVNIPSLVLFRVTTIDDLPRCRNLLYDFHPWALRGYLTTVSIIVFFVPFVVILVCYTLIFVRLRYKRSLMAERRTVQLSSCAEFVRNLWEILRTIPIRYRVPGFQLTKLEAAIQNLSLSEDEMLD